MKGASAGPLLPDLPGALGWLLALGAGLMPPLALFAPLGLAPLFGVLGTGAALGWIFAGRWPPWRGCAALTALGLFIVWAMVSSAWSPDSAYSFWRAARLAGETACGLLLLATVPVLRPYEGRRVQLFLSVGLVLAALLASIDLALGNAAIKAIRGPDMLPTAANRAACVMVLCLAPALLGLWRSGRWRLAAGLAALVLGAVSALASDAAKLAAILALIAALGGTVGLLRQRYALLLRFGVVTLLLGMPLLPQIAPPTATLAHRGLKASGLHRLLIWQFATQRLMEKPLAGWGLDAARMLPGGKQVVQVPLGHGQIGNAEIMPLHPHNGPLQVWLELGAVGVALLAAALFLALRRLFTLTRKAPAVLAAASWCLAAFTIACLSYGLWQSWWLAALWLSAVWLRGAVSDDLAPSS